MKEVLIIIAIALVIGVFIFLLEHWKISVPIIAVIVVLFICLNHRSKKKEEQKKINIENQYLNHPEVKKSLDEAFERIKFLDKVRICNDGFIEISAQHSRGDYLEPQYHNDLPRVYIKFDFEKTDMEYLELLKKASYDKDYTLNTPMLKQLSDKKLATTVLARLVFNTSYEELENGPLKGWYNSLFDESQYLEQYSRLILVMYLFPPRGKYGEFKDLTDEDKDDLYVKKLEQMYKEYINKEVPAATSPASPTVFTHKTESQKSVAPKNINAFLEQLQLPTNREITIGMKNCDIKGGYADKHAKIKKIGDDWCISNASLECRTNEKVTLKINGKEVGTSYTKLNSGDMITLVGIFHATNYKFTVQ